MKPIITPQVTNYIDKIQRKRDRVLLDLETDAIENNVPILGPFVGNFLSIMAHSCNAKNILEIGTATGYSGIWLARVAAENSGKLVTIEIDDERMARARKAFEKAGLTPHVETILGDAEKIVREMAISRRAEFDMVFMDVGSKKLYAELLDSCLSALRDGGIFLADDTLYFGVAESSIRNERARNMRRFNRLVSTDKRLESQIIPLGDGITLAFKKSDQK
jgi:predicted O-methyltransferase YrrM